MSHWLCMMGANPIPSIFNILLQEELTMTNEKEVAILMHSYKKKKDNKSIDDISNELLTLLEKNGFSAQIYEVEVRETIK